MRPSTPAIFLVTLILFGAVAMAKKPPIPQPDPDLGSIGVRIKTRSPTKLGRAYAHTVVFVKLASHEDGIVGDRFLRSSYTRGKHVYLLNTEPGRYLAVACQTSQTIEYYTYVNTNFFSEELIPITEVTVEPGEFVFMGEFVVDRHGKFYKEADPVQLHYRKLIAPMTSVYRGSLHQLLRDPETEQTFWAVARDKHFRNQSRWRELIQNKCTAPANGSSRVPDPKGQVIGDTTVPEPACPSPSPGTDRRSPRLPAGVFLIRPLRCPRRRSCRPR